MSLLIAEHGEGVPEEGDLGGVGGLLAGGGRGGEGQALVKGVAIARAGGELGVAGHRLPGQAAAKLTAAAAAAAAAAAWHSFIVTRHHLNCVGWKSEVQERCAEFLCIYIHTECMQD